MKKIFTSLTSLILTVTLIGCGGGGSSTATTTTPISTTPVTTPTTNPVVATPTNTITLKANGGINNNYLNGLFGSVTVCSPNTATTTNNCTTVDNILFDTGSVGLRIFSQVLPSNITLPNTVDSNGNKYAQCMQFASGVTWGSINNADIKMNGEVATNIPMQIIGNSPISIPSSCSSLGTAIQTAKDLGANGIMGIGLFKQDCGKGCESVINNNLYYVCAGNSCSNSAIPVAMQVQNPVSKFSQDNNGTIIVLNDVPDTGAVSTTGTLYFGIGTQTNNIKNLSVIKTNSTGLINIVYNGKTFTDSFLDSGSSITSFSDSSIKSCSKLTDYYCPDNATALPITLMSADNSSSVSSSIKITNAENVLNSNNIIFNNVVGNSETFNNNNTIDLGLSFFLGKTVATGIEGTTSNLGTGTYFAF